MSSIKALSLERFKTLEKEIKEGRYLLLDVRERAEFEAGHIPLAVLRPLSEVDRWSGEMDKDVPVVLTCKAGKRCQRCAEILSSQGFQDISYLEGGFVAWSSARAQERP